MVRTARFQCVNPGSIPGGAANHLNLINLRARYFQRILKVHHRTDFCIQASRNNKFSRHECFCILQAPD